MSRAAAGEKISEVCVVAKKWAAEAGRDGRIDLLFMEAVERGTTLPFKELEPAMSAETVAEVLEGCSTALLVHAGQKIAAEIPPEEGLPGSDVRGRSQTIPGYREVARCGRNVREGEDGYYAEITGYVYSQADLLAVVSALWISPDKMDAQWIHFPPAGDPVHFTSAEVMQLLEAEGVTHGIQETGVEQLALTDPGTFSRLFPTSSYGGRCGSPE